MHAFRELDLTEAVRSDPQLVVLHTLRCVGAAATERVAAIAQMLVDDDVEGVLLELAAAGMVAHDRGSFGGWRVTDAGRTADRLNVAAELDRAGTRDAVNAAYEDFLSLNQRVLEICSSWQIRSTDPIVLNDHTDRVYDSRVLASLAAVNGQARPMCQRLSALLQRFSHYGPRLDDAVRRSRDGEIDRVADSLDSFHSVWFQLHEDLLVTLGLGRGSPGN